MALSSTQKLQFLRLPVIDASVSTDDKYAFLGVVLTTTVAGTLPEALRKQVLRLPIVDASVSTSDKYALLGIFESADAGALYELFETTYLFDPTWTALESPQTNDGNVFIGISGFAFSWIGAVVNPIIPDFEVNQGTLIRNANATTDVASNYEICDRTGFRQYPGEMYVEYYGHAVRKKSFEDRHPQEIIKPRSTDKQHGSKSPEPADVFVGTINPEDL